MRRTTLLLALLVPCWSATVQAKVIERIVAVVGSNILLLSEIEERVRPLLPQLRNVPEGDLRKQREQELRRQMLDHMIDEKIIQIEADKLKITVSDQDLERAVKDVMRKNKLTREQLEQALQREGKSVHAYKHTILRPQLLRLRVLNVQVRSRVSVSEDEIKAFYQSNLRKLGVETKVRARHIFIAIPQNATAHLVAQRRKDALELLIRARKGEDFAELARKHSQDSVTRIDGGDLGWFGRGTLPSNVEQVVFTMKKGELRGPLRTERGFHVILLVDRRESSARPLSEVKDNLADQISAQKLEKATAAWLAEKRKSTHIDVRL